MARAQALDGSVAVGTSWHVFALVLVYSNFLLHHPGARAMTCWTRTAVLIEPAILAVPHVTLPVQGLRFRV